MFDVGNLLRMTEFVLFFFFFFFIKKMVFKRKTAGVKHVPFHSGLHSPTKVKYF